MRGACGIKHVSRWSNNNYCASTLVQVAHMRDSRVWYFALDFEAYLQNRSWFFGIKYLRRALKTCVQMCSVAKGILYLLIYFILEHCKYWSVNFVWNLTDVCNFKTLWKLGFYCTAFYDKNIVIFIFIIRKLRVAYSSGVHRVFNQSRQRINLPHTY